MSALQLHDAADRQTDRQTNKQTKAKHRPNALCWRSLA